MITELAIDCKDCGYKGTIGEFEDIMQDELEGRTITLGVWYICPKCDSDNIEFHNWEREIVSKDIVNHLINCLLP